MGEGADRPAHSMQAIVLAEIALAEDAPARAIELLLPSHDGSELYFSHAVLLRAYLANKDYAAALTEANWLSLERGRAFAESNSGDLWSVANIAESNLALLTAAECNRELGNEKQARALLERFDRAWPKPPAFLEPRLRRLREKPAPKSG
jgi:hypothetical protein